jgi:hypothetical protein
MAPGRHTGMSAWCPLSGALRKRYAHGGPDSDISAAADATEIPQCSTLPLRPNVLSVESSTGGLTAPHFDGV